MDWLAKHPALLTAIVVFGAALLAYYPLLLIPTLGAPLLWYGTQWWDRRYQTQAARKRSVIARAEYEHWLLTHGHPAGTYGAYPPART